MTRTIEVLGDIFPYDLSTIQSANSFSTFTANSDYGPYVIFVIVPFSSSAAKLTEDFRSAFYIVCHGCAVCDVCGVCDVCDMFDVHEGCDVCYVYDVCV